MKFTSPEDTEHEMLCCFSWMLYTGGQRRSTDAFWGEGRKIRLCKENSGHTGLNRKSMQLRSQCVMCWAVYVCWKEETHRHSPWWIRAVTRKARHDVSTCKTEVAASVSIPESGLVGFGVTHRPLDTGLLRLHERLSELEQIIDLVGILTLP